MMLYEDSKSKVRVADRMSKEFPIKVGVHPESALSPLLFILVMDEATKECRSATFEELLYADDLVLIAQSKEEAEQKFFKWKRAMAKSGMKVNIGKTKMMVTGKKSDVIESVRYPCGVCGRGVSVNSIHCVSCHRWCHRRCSGLQRLNNIIDCKCPSCNGNGRHQPQGDEVNDQIQIGEEIVEDVQQF